MKLVLAVRALRRRPRLLVAALVLACLVGMAIPYRIGFPPSLTARQHGVGTASASALVDSPRSQVADLGATSGNNVGTLAYRASLLASLMTSPSIKNAIAQAAGVPARELVANGPATVVGTGSPTPSVSYGTTTASGPKASVLTASVPTLPAGQIPVIQVATQAPTAALAANLANDAFSVLQSDVNSVAGADNIPALQRVVIRPLGPASSSSVSQGPVPLFGILGGIVFFFLACGAILGVSSFAASWRNESAREDASHRPSDPFLDEPARRERIVAFETHERVVAIESHRQAHPPQAIEHEPAGAAAQIKPADAIVARSAGVTDEDVAEVLAAAQELPRIQPPSKSLDLAYSRLSRLLEINRSADGG